MKKPCGKPATSSGNGWTFPECRTLDFCLLTRISGTDESKLAPSPNDSALKARTQCSSSPAISSKPYSGLEAPSAVLNGESNSRQIGRTEDYVKRSAAGASDISSAPYRHRGTPEEVPANEVLTPLHFDTDEALEETPSIFRTFGAVGGSPKTFIYLSSGKFDTWTRNEDPCQTFIISPDTSEHFVHRKNTINKMKAVNEVTEEGRTGEYLSFVARKRCDAANDVGAESQATDEVTDIGTSAKKILVNSSDSGSLANCNKCDSNAECGGERPVHDDAVLSFDRTITGKKEQAFSRLQDELEKARQELKLKDEEVSRLTRIREDVERELEELTASLFQEAHKMVREANEKQAMAEKALTESQMKVEVLTAEVAALKTLVLTSTPSRPNPHLHPQISKEEAAGVNLFNRKHRRSPSHFNLKYGRENSPPGSPVRDQRVSLSESSSCSVDVREAAEMDPNLQRDFLNWKETAKLDKSDPFISRIYREDINLCLDFNNKELGEEVRKAIESRTIFVEAVTDKTKTIFPRKCALLEATRQCHYRMKLGDQDTWYSISQMCRNRIIAVCDFFNYLRYIELGLVKSTAHDMYWEIIRLRKEMVLARLGLSLSSS